MLKRNELREFKIRFKLSVEKARANQFVRPYRIAFPRTSCGFVFISDHFVDINEMVTIGSGAEREVEDWALSRYACWHPFISAG